MTTERKNDFSQPMRQSPKAMALIITRFLKKMARQFWPLLLIWLFKSRGKYTQYFIYIIYIAMMGACFQLITSIVAYFRFRFHLTDEEFVLEKGLFQRTRLNIPFDRIQTVNFTQNIIHQALNVVSVEIDTAGSDKQELTIDALERPQAEALRKALLTHKQQSRLQADQPEETLREVSPLQEEEVLIQLSIPDLLKIGISQNHFQAAGIIMAFLFGLKQFLQDTQVLKTDSAYFNDLIKINKEAFLKPLLILLGFFVVASVLVSLVRTVLQHYNLRLYRTTLGFKRIAGLFDRREQTATLKKIQLLRWGTTPLKKWFGFYQLQLRHASSSNRPGRQVMTIEGCSQEQIERVRLSYFPQESSLDFTSHRIERVVIWRRTLYLGVLPAILLCLIQPFEATVPQWLWLFWIPVMYFISRKYYQKWQYEVSWEGLRCTKGIVGEDANLLQWYKVQSVRIKQTLYQQRKGFANIVFHTAAGKVEIPYIQLTQAQELRDFVLYKVETDRRNWM